MCCRRFTCGALALELIKTVEPADEYKGRPRSPPVSEPGSPSGLAPGTGEVQESERDELASERKGSLRRQWPRETPQCDAARVEYPWARIDRTEADAAHGVGGNAIPEKEEVLRLNA